MEEVTSRRDPQGYYVVVYPLEARSHLARILESREGEVYIEEYGDTVIVRSKSRRVVKRVVVELAKRGYEPLEA